MTERETNPTSRKTSTMEPLTFDEIIALLKSPPALERTITYVQRRRCFPYRPFNGRTPYKLATHLLEHRRKCFNCGLHEVEHAGTCWGNCSCEIWVCANCVADVRQTLETLEPVEAA